MATRKPPMIAKLARGVRTKDGDILRTRGEARDYMAALPERRALYRAWQHAARLLLDGADAEALTMEIELALMLDGHRRFR
jgi:hypothetical protein